MNRYKSLRKKKGWKQHEVASYLSVSTSTVSKWETDVAIPDPPLLKKIAELYDTTTDYLLGSTTLSGYGQNISPAKFDRNTISIPVLGKIPAGIPIDAIEDIEGYEDIPKKWTLNGEQYFGLIVKGDSMSPKYLDGDTVILRKQFDCESGQDCAVLVNGCEATLKKVVRQPNGITLQPLNPAYEPVFYTSKEIQNIPIRLLGVVVQVRRNI